MILIIFLILLLLFFGAGAVAISPLFWLVVLICIAALVYSAATHRY
jgi:hypothetical protein